MPVHATISDATGYVNQDELGINTSGSGAKFLSDGNEWRAVMASEITGTLALAQIEDISSDRLIGRDTAGSGDPEQLTVGGGVEFTGSGGIQRSALTGDVTASAGSNATTIANDAVTYAKMQNVSATSRIIGRKTSGSGDPEECTISDVLGFVSATQGVILYCGASSTWAALGTGTVGKVLMTGGAAANPSWGYRAFDVTIQAASGTDLTWTNMPAAQTLWLGTGRHIFKADLGDYQQVRLLINVRSVAANAGSTVDVMYSTSYTETIGSLSAIGTSACQVTLGSTSTILDSGWIDLAAGAKAANVFVALVGAGGDGAIDPTFGGVHVQFR